MACGSPEPDEGEPQPEPETFEAQEFRFALIADPHVTGPGSHVDRLRVAVDYLIEEHARRPLDFVPILGDVAWNDGFAPILEVLDTLPMPWVPVVGDNSYASGSAEAYDQAFADQYAYLADTLDGWNKAPNPVALPTGEDALFHNFSFDHKGIHVVGLDLTPRTDHPLFSEMADLHDIEGGTWRFLVDDLATMPDGPKERVVLLSHQPMVMMPGGLDEQEMDVVVSELGTMADLVAWNFSGHLHLDAQWPDQPAGYDAVTLDATWDDEITLMLVDVRSDGITTSWTTERVVLPQ